ncbi:glycosyltransferase family 2 protein [Konateibacter massiliensis]|uniref:glycosyltransferase family 2 protein n=1 Tax=Konateibacter massiliensis TaxID=2002841 RepID=UPI000C147548|nr:glycosyltransferase [Konateibacter massiliensis]
MSTKVSVIVPVYNVEQYLDRCVKSIQEQTMEELEIILVDDGSTDSSGKMCDVYANSDPRIWVVHKENGGLTSAWKTGVNRATGEFVGFVDSDDWVDKDMFATLYERAKESDADLTICGLVYEFEDGTAETKTESSKLAGKVYERADIEKEIYPTLLSDGSFFGRTIQPARVTKLYRRQIVLDNMKYCSDTVSIGEDLQLTFPVLCDAKRVCMIEDYFPYHYWINEKSMTGRHDEHYVVKIAETMNQLLNISIQKNVYDFFTQITNDFLCLTILGIKSEIMKNYKSGFRTVIKNLKKIFNMPEVREAIRTYDMPRLSLAEKIYIKLIKFKLYRCCFFITFVFFKIKG